MNNPPLTAAQRVQKGRELRASNAAAFIAEIMPDKWEAVYREHCPSGTPFPITPDKVFAIPADVVLKMAADALRKDECWSCFL